MTYKTDYDFNDFQLEMMLEDIKLNPDTWNSERAIAVMTHIKDSLNIDDLDPQMPLYWKFIQACGEFYTPPAELQE